jgi:hypothetical protein
VPEEHLVLALDYNTHVAPIMLVSNTEGVSDPEVEDA